MKKEACEYMTWEMFDKASREIARWAKDRKFTGIYGPPRGGIVLAVKLSHLLKIPLIVSKDDITPNVLIAEDIKDSGKTLLADSYRNCQIVTLYWNKQLCQETDVDSPEFYVYEKMDKYIVFPWEI